MRFVLWVFAGLALVVLLGPILGVGALVLLYGVHCVEVGNRQRAETNRLLRRHRRA